MKRQLTLQQYHAEQERQKALRAYRVAPKGQRTVRRKRAVWATAGALRAAA